MIPTLFLKHLLSKYLYAAVDKSYANFGLVKEIHNLYIRIW